ncbi:uncharacterized protein B0H64DRAFT_468637 [Chaetomium fimeti]|uniref:Uncharacterized protein n=1 Tax=Chaetomium fimeti TaxID=1854472 RepID=A0AAE0H8F1_9PEZI|nr:hypothetical protein B0H64DRAFT_468637 [Chaetomium fimeti]
MAPKIYSAQTPADLAALTDEQSGLLAQLDTQELKSSASRWSNRHLIAYRLLTSPETTVLEAFKTDHENQCPVCRPGESGCLQKLNPDKTKAITEKDNPHDFTRVTECELMELPDGFFWIALARTCRTELLDEVRVQPQRERKPVEKEGFVNSSTAIDGPSSPVVSSGSEFEDSIVSADNLGEDEHEELRSKPEDATVNLISCFLRYALSGCLLQDRKGRREVQPRTDRLKAKARISGVKDIAAEDDGGICVAQRRLNGWGTQHPYLALVEAKRAFKYIHFDDQTGKSKPIVSNETLAQYLGEAVITWKANRNLLAQDVFLIAATNVYVRFVHFRFGSDYEQYVDATNVEVQRALVDDPARDTCVHMQATKWFNLASARGRRGALCHVLALLRWHQAHGVLVD